MNAEQLARELHGVIARGWCSTENSHKEMDVILAEAITQEVLAWLIAHDAELLQPLQPGPCQKLGHLMVHLVEGQHTWHQGPCGIGCIPDNCILCAADAETVAAMLEQAAELIPSVQCPCDGCLCLAEFTEEGRKVVADAIRALSPQHR